MFLPRLARDPLRNSYSDSPYVLIRDTSGLLFALGDNVDTHHHHTTPPALHQPGASSSAFHPQLLCLATPFSGKQELTGAFSPGTVWELALGDHGEIWNQSGPSE